MRPTVQESLVFFDFNFLHFDDDFNGFQDRQKAIFGGCRRPIGGFFELVMRGSLQKIEYSMCRHDHLDPNKAQEYTPDCVFFDAFTD